MNQVDELMDLIANEVAAAERGAFDRIRKALEAALKPDVSKGTGQYSDIISDGGFDPRNAAPPAQTPVPPRLTDEQWHKILRDESWDSDDWVYERAIESAVRKQFGVNDE
jgi:hypothetical protein